MQYCFLFLLPEQFFSSFHYPSIILFITYEVNNNPAEAGTKELLPIVVVFGIFRGNSSEKTTVCFSISIFFNSLRIFFANGQLKVLLISTILNACGLILFPVPIELIISICC